ncbi:MAG: PEGA domain-containing protein [Chloroflexi bacterium]|nr:PEGA domain-containing protein [Chloroflexota bacterium]
MKRLSFIVLFLVFFSAIIGTVLADTATGKVTDVDGKIIRFDLTSKDGVSANTGGKIFHPLTNKLTGNSINVPIGKFVVTEVGSEFSRGKIVEIGQGWVVSKGDIIELEVSFKPPVTTEPVVTPPVRPPTTPSTTEPVETPSTVISQPEKAPEGIPVPQEPPPSIGELVGTPLETAGTTCTLSIKCDPEGSQVFVDRRLLGTAPLTLENLSPGKHLVRVVNPPNYAYYMQDVELTPEQSWELTVKLTLSTKAYLEAGIEAYKGGDLKKASENLLSAVKYLPLQADALYYLGLVYNKAGRKDDAVKMLRAYAFYSPKSLAMRIHLGRLYEDRNEWGKALTSYKMGVIAIPEYEAAVGSITSFTNETMNKYRALSASDPGNSTYHVILGVIYEHKGMMKQGVAELKAALRVYLRKYPLPDNTEI